MDIQPVQKWSEILDDYEVSLEKTDYETCFIVMDRNEGTPVSDVYSEEVSFVFVGDSIEQVTEAINKFIPTALQSDDVFTYATNWAFIRTKYKAVNYNGKRITIAHTNDGASTISSTSIFSRTLVPTVSQWFTAIFQTDGDSYGLLSRGIEGKEFALVCDEPDEMLAMLIKSNNDEIAIATMSNPQVTLASVGLTKIAGACQGIFYRGNLYLVNDIVDEAERCIQKFSPEQESTIGLLNAIRQTGKDKETEDK